jgi:acyl carrier protein
MATEQDGRETTDAADGLGSEVRAAILEVAPDLDMERLRPDRDLRVDFGLDSIDVLNVAAAIQERTGIEIPEADLSGLDTVGDLLRYIERRRGGAT